MPIHSSIATLYLIQSSYARIPMLLQELSQFVQTDDMLVLLEDSVFALQHPHSQAFSSISSIAVLKSDAHLIDPAWTDRIHIISYLDLATMIEQAQKVHTWK